MKFSKQDRQWMKRALLLAKKAEEKGEVPVGAVLVKDGAIIAEAFNQPITLSDPSAHAEILVLREGAKALSNYRIVGSELFVTIEPCMMCAGALIHARVNRLVFGTREPKAGVGCSHLQVFDQNFVNHKVKVEEGLFADECSALLSGFFKNKRTKPLEK